MIRLLSFLRLGYLYLGFLASFAVCLPAHAHKVIASVWAEGDLIEGEVAFSNGDAPPAGTPVEVLDPDGKKLAEVLTDGDGIFHYAPTQAITYTFRTKLGSGHVAEATLGVDELPVRLKLEKAGESSDAFPGAAGSTQPSAGGAASVDLQVMIAEAVQNEIRPLRKDLDAYKEKNDLQNILGGIGYICGIFGLLFFFYARRSKVSS